MGPPLDAFQHPAGLASVRTTIRRRGLTRCRPPVNEPPRANSEFRRGTILREGILFATYAALRSPARQGKPSRLDQIVAWLAGSPDEGDRHAFDGVVIFDEPHAMANAAGSKGILAAARLSRAHGRSRRPAAPAVAGAAARPSPAPLPLLPAQRPPQHHAVLGRIVVGGFAPRARAPACP